MSGSGLGNVCEIEVIDFVGLGVVDLSRFMLDVEGTLRGDAAFANAAAVVEDIGSSRHELTCCWMSWLH